MNTTTAAPARWTRLSAGNYSCGEWFVQSVRSDYGDTQWIVDAPDAPSWGTFDTLREAKVATAAKIDELARR